MPDVRGKKILVVGDSLSWGQFSPGAVMAERLVGAEAVKINARIGRSAHNFFGREDWAAQLAQVKAWDPDLVIVVLGTNDIGLSMKVDGLKMRQLHDQLGAGGADVWAFGPPAFATGTREHAGSPAVISMMKAVFGGRFLDLRPLTADLTVTGRSADQIHFTAQGGKVAGERMADHLIAARESVGGWALAVAVVVAGYFAFR